MAKKTAATTHMDQTERVAGAIFFVVYLLVMPLLLERLFSLAETLLGTRIEPGFRNALCYYFLFAVTLVIFHRFLALTSSRFFDDLNRSLTALFLSLLVFYGANELMYRVLSLFFANRPNLNDTVIVAQISAVPRTTTLIVVFLAPFVEEVLFRGLVFGCLKEASRPAAYVVSAALFSLLHVWTLALWQWDFTYLILMLQYLVPGLVFAWAFDRSGTLWTSILLHAIVNALALYVIL